MEELYRSVVDSGRRRLKLDWIGLFLCDEARGEILGTQGTDIRGRVVDESNFREAVPAFIAEILGCGECLTVWEDRELTNRNTEVG